ncbi:MAG: hypothetical protein QGF00_27575 [Planctomycetota bacterium]|jgi:hypothetical protein|nr:hypothetical protein [Planctomycetota bacterium]
MSESNAKALEVLDKAMAEGNGILRCDPAWIARDFLPPGKRLGLKEEEYDVGERGSICERWIVSETKADNAIGPDDEGLSYINLADGSDRVLLTDALEAGGKQILGDEYQAAHGNTLGRLAKLFDFGSRIPYHYHQRKEDAALVGANSKEEAYFFPEGAEMGDHPETFFGVKPWIVEQGEQEILLPYLQDWDSDLILQHAWAELLVPGDGFHIPPGILHGPGTALTFELQENSDVFSMCQALVAGKIIPKELLYKDIRKEDVDKYGERIVLKQIDWELSGDRHFYENRHLGQRLVEETNQDGGTEYWIFYNTTTFSGKRLVVEPGQSFTCSENGVFSVLVWKGKGTIGGLQVVAGDFGHDELLVTHDRALQDLEYKNESNETMEVWKFFGPDINPDCPGIPEYKVS